MRCRSQLSEGVVRARGVRLVDDPPSLLVFHINKPDDTPAIPKPFCMRRRPHWTDSV